MGPFAGVIFDFDGTLIDSHDAMWRAYEVWANEYHVDLDELPNHLGMPSESLAKALIPAEKVDEAAARIEYLETHDTDGVVALPGAVETLEALAGQPVAIGTSCTMDLLQARGGAAGLPMPAVLVTRDQVERGKPNPDTFLLACQRLGIAPEAALVVEDAPAGVKAARAAGCTSLGVLTNRTAEDLGADGHTADLSHVTWQVTGDGILVSLR